MNAKQAAGSKGGKIGGRKGGLARASKMTDLQHRIHGALMARARWKGHDVKKKKFLPRRRWTYTHVVTSIGFEPERIEVVRRSAPSI